jgi:hypothetical protein
VLEECVALLRFSPWKSRSTLRPAGWIARAVLRPKALHRGPGGNLRAVDREMLVRQQPTQLLVVQQFRQELARHVRFEQSIAVLGTHTGSSIPSPTNQR